ncbi:type IV pilus biogenesis/stability protein PilW [Ottowia thiooxydans]|uniref:type IV pilus biogenesis/stability protein PilW n=1 Tax=Ottowia thiooxydans TaxID=219182 RepID=UPI00041A59F2|nr:type IV pilus biogenesis/stability protein PilW [Ottowia thiooxydans]
MPFISQRRFGFSPAHLLCLLALLAGLAGCASQPGESGSSANLSSDIQTPSDDSDERKRARTRMALAVGYFENGQHNVALDEFKKVVQIDPSFGDAYNLGGMIYMALNDRQVAEAHFQRAVSLNPRDANALHNLGWLQCEQRRYAEAAQSFQRALAVPGYPARAMTLMTQGICEARAGDRATAEATLMRSYELDAGNPVTGFNLSQLLYLRGDYSRAQFYIRRLNNSEQANAESLWLGMKVERRMNNNQAMQQLASQLRRRFPQSRELQSFERGSFDD